MFYCDGCGLARGWPTKALSRSAGTCEICDFGFTCNDVHHSALPVPVGEIVVVTGHRPDKLGGYSGPTALRVETQVKGWMEKKLTEIKPRSGISGMALGIDQWFAEVCISMAIPLIAAVPFPGQESIWPWRSQQRYAKLLARAAGTFFVTATKPASKGSVVDALHKRNMWQTKAGTIMLAVWDGTPGGTAHCHGFAQSIGRKIYRLDPSPLRV